MKAVSILSGVTEGDVDAPGDLKIDPDPALFPIRSAVIPANRDGQVLGRAEVYFDRVEVRARCYFNSTSEFLDALIEFGGRPVIESGGGVFAALVKISAGCASVSVAGRELPVVSVQVEIDPGKLVGANVIFPEPAVIGSGWTPGLCVLLLEACGWKFKEVAP